MTTREKLQEKGVNLNTLLASCTLLGMIITGVLFIAPLRTLPEDVTVIRNAQTKQTAELLKMEWEIPNIKLTQITDRAELLRQIENIEKRMQSSRELNDVDRSEIAKIKMEIALLKQKLALQ